MKQELILLPVFAMALLTALVWTRLYVVRVGEIRARRMSPQELASRREGAELLRDTRASDNFMNLFELPVLFYALCILLYVLGLTDAAYLWLAVLFTALRYLHSAIHVTYNRVMHRFVVYVAGSLVLWSMWACFGFQLLARTLA